MLPPKGIFADTAFHRCDCGTMVRRGERCPFCRKRAPRQDLVLAAGGGPVGLAKRVTLYPDSNYSSVITLSSGTETHLNATPAQLHDGLDSTADEVVAHGDGLIEGNVTKDVGFRLGAAVVHHPLNTISFVRIRIRAEATGDPLASIVIFVWQGGSSFTLPSPGPPRQPDDFLSDPVGTLGWAQKDYVPSADLVVGFPATSLADLQSYDWGFSMRDLTFDPFSNTGIRTIEYEMEVWGPD